MKMNDALEACKPLPPSPQLLHIDADDTAAVILATLLVPEIRVTRAASLAEAELLVSRQDFALIVLDPDLPDGDGQTLLRTMREQGQHTPVLLYSARQPSLHHQAHAFLPKPWTSPRQLWQATCRLLQLDLATATAR